jgi:hypothetical protein
MELLLARLNLLNGDPDVSEYRESSREKGNRCEFQAVVDDIHADGC